MAYAQKMIALARSNDTETKRHMLCAACLPLHKGAADLPHYAR